MPITQLIEPVPQTDPPEYRLTSEGREFLKELLQAQYLSRFLQLPPLIDLGPRPSPSVFDREPEPQTNGPFKESLQNSLIGELLIHAIGDSAPRPEKVSIINQIKKEKLDVEVVEGLIGDLESGIKMLKNEFSAIKI